MGVGKDVPQAPADDVETFTSWIVGRIDIGRSDLFKRWWRIGRVFVVRK